MNIEHKKYSCCYCKHFNISDTKHYHYCRESGLENPFLGQGVTCPDFADYSENKCDLSHIPQGYILDEKTKIVGFPRQWFIELTKERTGLIGWTVRTDRGENMPFYFFKEFDAKIYGEYLRKEYPHRLFEIVEVRKIDL